MKYYSEKLGKLFDTEEKLREEEKTHDDKATKYHEELSKLRSEYTCALNAQNEMDEKVVLSDNPDCRRILLFWYHKRLEILL